MPKIPILQVLLLSLLLLAAVSPVAAQSPNTASVVVQVVDQTGAAVKDAKVAVTNTATGAQRDAVSGNDGIVTIAALPLTGAYSVTVAKSGFSTEELTNIALRSGETATLNVKLNVGSAKADVSVYGTTEGVRADAEIGDRFDNQEIAETPILGRKASTIPLLDAAFRQAKGTGDLFVNQTYFVTGAGSRRTTTNTLDGGNNDESWGRQTAIAQMPLGAIQEVTVLSSAFSAEFGWTAGPALNIVTKSGSNTWHGEGLYLGRPGGWQAKSFSTKNFCPPSVPTCVTPSTLTSISPVDVPDKLSQGEFTLGGPIVKDRTFFFVAGDYTWQNRTTYLSNTLPSFVLPSNGDLAYTGHYRQALLDARIDQRIASNQNLMLRFNLDHFHDDNPQDAVGGSSAPSVARYYARRAWTLQLAHTASFGPSVVNEARFNWLDGDPVNYWSAPNISTSYTRTGSVPFTIGQSRFSNNYSRQAQFSDTLSISRGKHYIRVGTSVVRHMSGGFGSEPGTAALGTFTFKSTTTAPFDQLTLNDVQSYTQPINFGVSTFNLNQWLIAGFVQDTIHLHRNFTVDLGLRYDWQSTTDATRDFAPRVGFGWHPWGSTRTSIRGGYGMYYSEIQSNLIGGYLTSGLDGLTTYTAVPGQLGFPTCLTGSCLPLQFDPKTLLASQLPARDITIQAGRRAFYEQQFNRYGLNFDSLPYYPNQLVNPRSQVVSIGAEREFLKGFFFGGDYVHQHWTDLDRNVDLNAPSVFDRTAPGQVRTVAAANATRPILPVNGGVRQVNVLMNLGTADYDGLQTQFSYRGNSHMFAQVSYTLSKATNTTEPDGNGISPDQSIIARLGENERGPSVLDQRHRVVIMYMYRLPFHLNVGTLTSMASARPFNATTGVDNNGDGLNNDRPVINGAVMGKSAFRGTPTSDVGVFVEERISLSERMALVLRVEGTNLFNHANMLGRGQTVYGDTGTASSTFGQFVAVGNAATAIPAFANIDPPRMFQLQARFQF